jgi:hypothetical protein
MQNHTPCDNIVDYDHAPLSTWILNDYKVSLKHPKIGLHIFLAPSSTLEKCCLFSPCGSWIVWTKILHWGYITLTNR